MFSVIYVLNGRKNYIKAWQEKSKMTLTPMPLTPMPLLRSRLSGHEFPDVRDVTQGRRPE
jgi:hypothetical protein